MGCGQSKNQIGITPGMQDTNKLGGSPTKRPPSKKINVKSGEKVDNTQTSDLEDDQNVPTPQDSRKKKKNKALVKKNSWVMGSQDSLGVSEGGSDSRGGSATSKSSHHSADSGFDDNDYQKVITESSDPDAVKAIEDGFETPRGLDLGVVGKPVPQRYSAKDKERLEEQRVLASLREEGLITRPMSRATGGLAFEVTSENSPPKASFDPLGGGRGMLPPIRLAKLEKRKKRRRKLTEEDIKAKLEKADERRREAEKERLEKIQAVTMKSNVQTALDSFAELQKSKESEVTVKVDMAAENREKRLKEMRDKLKAKQEHAEKVRRRKQLAVDLPDQNQPPLTASTSFNEDAPIMVRPKQV